MAEWLHKVGGIEWTRQAGMALRYSASYRYDPRLLAFLSGALLVVSLFSFSSIFHSSQPGRPNLLTEGDGSRIEYEHILNGEDGWYPAEANTWTNTLSDEENEASQENMRIEHVEVKSRMTPDGKWFTVDFLTQGSFNPSIIPHPYKEETYIMIAQRDKSKDDNDIWNTEIVCEATYHAEDQTMKCTSAPMILPIASTTTDECTGALSVLADVIGPHDARIFYGPDRPFIMYGSQSENSCLGQWIHDFRRLVAWSNRSEGATTHPSQDFFFATDLQRPPPYGKQEKNWFAFWDSKGQMYIHHDLTASHRVFAKLAPNGSVSEDLAPLATRDHQCMSRLMPKLHQNGHEAIHQATNSLSITLCNRRDRACHPTRTNTFNFILFQSKTFYGHGVYEPYLMLFNRDPPFQVHGVSSMPFWYSGRGKVGELWRWSTWKPNDQTQMVFTTQMAWKGMGMGYHGYLDDELIISFGIEDKHGGGLDVVAADLMQGMAFCEDDG